jgi:hypothetical protein
MLPVPIMKAVMLCDTGQPTSLSAKKKIPARYVRCITLVNI